MSFAATERIALDSAAATFAFRVGQLFERALLDRGLEVAEQSNSRLITAEQLERCIDSLLLDRAVELLREEFDERSDADPPPDADEPDC